MRINHMIKTDQWRAAPQIRILLCPPFKSIMPLTGVSRAYYEIE